MNALARLIFLLIFLFCTACSVNPVTGNKQLLFTPKSTDIEIGQTQYKPAQQAQGGEYYLDPKLSAYVSAVGNKLAAVSDQPGLPYEFVVLNNSVPNAWALPSGKIAINRGLLTQLENEAQLAAVLSHEIVHAAARHGAQRMQNNILMQVAISGLGLTLADNDYRSLIIGGAGLGAQLTLARYGRDHELESDQYGMKYMAKAGYDLQGAVELQALFVKLSQGKSSSWLQGLFASHPPSPERVAANRQHRLNFQNLIPANTTPFTGEAEYQQALAYLHSKEPAYTLADKASAALNNKQSAQALSLINNAIEIEPGEALFHAIKGTVLETQGRSSLALESHNRATQLYPQQFSYYLNRAKSHQSLGNISAAQHDYQQSMNRLPTSSAALALGQLSENSGNHRQAIAYYSQATEAQGEPGQQARLRLAKLEIHAHPEKYLKVNHHQDPTGYLLVTIENNSPLSIKEVSLSSALFDKNSKLIEQKSWKITSPISANSRSRHYPVPVTYHLEAGQSVQTRVEALTLEH